MKVYQGNLFGKGKKFIIVVSRFNEFISKKLVEGAVDILMRHNVEEQGIEIIWVPGSLEILYMANKIAKENKQCDAIICLGAIISQISLTGNLPIISGVITADSLEQAIQRAGAKEGNKGASAAMAALEMANLPQIGFE